MNDSESFNGYTLFAPNHSTSTFIIDNYGMVVKEWISDYVPRLSVYLLSNGNLLRSAAIESNESNAAGGFELYSWDNTLLWKYYYGQQHHDIEPLPNGNVLLLVNDFRSYSEAIESGRNPNKLLSNNLKSLSILEIAQTGEESGIIVWEWHAWDHIIQDYNEDKSNFGMVEQHPELIDINYAPNIFSDWLHTNSLAYNDDINQIMVSNRNTNEIWIIDHSTTSTEAAGHQGGNSGRGGDLLFRWGNPIAYSRGSVNDQILFGQHNAHWVEEDSTYQKIMIFNNGIDRPGLEYSEILEISVPFLTNYNYSQTNEGLYGPVNIIYSYQANDTTTFFSPRYGSAQRLDNQNTLICNSDSGEMFEVDSESNILWKYINPVSINGILAQGEEASSNPVFRCHRYGINYSAFLGRDMTPIGPIENYLSLITENREEFNYEGNIKAYPNPFNNQTTISFDSYNINNAEILIHDINGRRIKSYKHTIRFRGRQKVVWNGLDNKGNPVSSGNYYCTVRHNNFLNKIEITLVK